jgi:hypothetical protein
MSKLQSLAAIIEQTVFNEIEDYWTEAKTYGEIRLSRTDTGFETDLLTPHIKDGNRIAANYAKGIYRWIEKKTGKILYVGKTDGKTMSIHLRQGNHTRSFCRPDEHHEVSGRKYREYLKENGLHSMDVVIQYIDTVEYGDLSIAPIIEDASIQHFQPIMNSEIKGRGSRGPRLQQLN